MLDKIINGNVLVISPHCDDEILGCGGTLLKYRNNISNLSIVYMVGDDARRKVEANKILLELKASSSYFFSYKDGFINANYEACVISLIEVIQKEKPNIMFMPHSGEEHPDHVSVSNIAYDAAQKARYWQESSNKLLHKTPTILKYEVWTPIGNPSLLCDITGQFSSKLTLLNFYLSQTESFPYIDYITHLNGWRGCLHQRVGYVEAFECTVL